MFQRRVAAIGMIAAGALLFSACGSDNNAGGEGAASPEAAGVQCAGKDSLRASGSSAQANAMTRFNQTYQQLCEGKNVDYSPSGSGAGRTEFVGGQTDFAGTDAALDEEETGQAAQRCASPAWHLPIVFGPVAIAYNVAGVTDLVLDGPTIARIFNGGITTWNDPAIAALNPGKPLPAAPIVVNFRSDESGTTENFQTYLQVAGNGAWTQDTGGTFAGGVGAGSQGSDGVANATAATPNSITYVEASFAQRQNIPIAQVINSGGGAPVALTNETVGAAIDSVAVQGQGNDLILDVNSIFGATAPGAYPITLATYEVVCSRYQDPETAAAVKAFLQASLSDQAQQALPDAGYAPIPQRFKDRLSAAVNAIA